MTLTRSFVRNAAMTPLDARLMNMAQIVANADGSPRPGVLGNKVTPIVTPLATMTVAVAASEFATSKGKADGVAIFTNDGTVNVAIGAAPASNSRIDSVWVKHNDDTTGDANALPVFGVTAGVAAASPTAPAIPTGALELAQVRVYAGTTAANGGANTTTQTYQMTAARGGVVPFRTKAAVDAWTTAEYGQLAYDTAGNSLYVWNGTTWQGRIEDTGWVTVTPFLNSWVANGSYPVTVRRVNGVIYWRGRLQGGSAGPAVNIPAGFSPANDMLFSGVDGGSATARAWIFVRSLGQIQLTTGQAPQLDGVCYPVN